MITFLSEHACLWMFEAELLTLAVLQALPGFVSEARWLRFAASTCGTCFPTCPAKPLRQIIESVNDTFKGQLDLERHGGHTPAGVLTACCSASSP